MIYLSGVHNSAVVEVGQRLDLGLLVQPGNSLHRQLGRYRWWAADNGCFAQGEDFDLRAYLVWLERLPRAGCLFATAPDVLGDPIATWARSKDVLPIIRALGFPAALVAQDGFERTVVDWTAFDVLFIGGSTDWKLSEGAASAINWARSNGKWAHMGRVNSLRRMRAANLRDCDSVDGTFLAFRARQEGGGKPQSARGLPELVEWLETVERELHLPVYP